MFYQCEVIVVDKIKVLSLYAVHIVCCVGVKKVPPLVFVIDKEVQYELHDN